MREFFSVYTQTPWDGQNTNQLAHVRLLSGKSILSSFPVIQEEFFGDLISNIRATSQYTYFKSIKRIVGPEKEDYGISNWYFLWASDRDRRMYQLLFQREKKEGSVKSILVAMAPPELCKLIQDHGREAITRTLSLLNSPKQMGFLMVLGPKGKSIAEEQQLMRVNQKDADKVNFLKQMPNLNGQWFPSFKPRCPICNATLVGMENYEIGFGQLVCPRCGYKKL